MVYYEPPPKEMPSVVPVSAIKRTPPGVPVRELLQLYKAPVPFAPDEFVLNVSEKSIQQLNTSETSGSVRQTMLPNGVCTANENSYNGYMQGMQTTPTH